MDAIGRLRVVALDTPDPRGLAEFYSALTGWPIGRQYEDDWIELDSDTGATMAFQLAPDHEPPVWPSSDRPQQMHLDFAVDDLDDAEVRALELGARKAEVQPGETFRVFLDPAGHPFCFVTSEV